MYVRFDVNISMYVATLLVNRSGVPPFHVCAVLLINYRASNVIKRIQNWINGGLFFERSSVCEYNEIPLILRLSLVTSFKIRACRSRGGVLFVLCTAQMTGSNYGRPVYRLIYPRYIQD
jgi:hypothetical protein